MSAHNIAFVYDWLDSQGGAERVLQVLADTYPDADWYTTYIATDFKPPIPRRRLHTSFIQKLPSWIQKNRLLSIFLYPLAFESFDLGKYDIVVSITSAFAKAVITRPGTRHVCYLLTPPRWLWSPLPKDTSLLTRIGHKILAPYLKEWDRITAQRVDEFICISREVQARCLDAYGHGSVLLYPPFDYQYWHELATKSGPCPQVPSQYFLYVGRLESYKRVDLLLQAYSLYTTQYPDERVELVIVGLGREKTRLTTLAQTLGIADHIHWYDTISDRELAHMYARSEALIMPQLEDFGYVACEAIACGTKVVTYARGGQIEIVTDGVTGCLFESQTAVYLMRALVRVREIRYNPPTYENSHIRGWSRDTFVATFSQKITQAV